MITMTTTAYGLVLWVLTAFIVLACALLVICEVLYRRLASTKKMLSNFQSSPPLERLDRTPNITMARETMSTTGNITLSAANAHILLKGSTFDIPKTMIPVVKKIMIEAMSVSAVFIGRVYKGLRCVSINKDKNQISLPDITKCDKIWAWSIPASA